MEAEAIKAIDVVHNTKILEIIDTAVKIGLGALITAISAYFITILNHKNNAKSELRKRQLDIIESAITHINEYLNSFMMLLSSIDGVIRDIPETKALDNTLDEHFEAFTFIAEHDDNFIKARNHKDFAASKLHLAGLSSIVSYLDEITELEGGMRIKVMFKKELPSMETSENWQKHCKNLRIKIFSEISASYNALK